MGRSRVCWRLICSLDLYLCLAAACFFIHCDARKAAHDVFRASTHSGNSDIGPPDPPQPQVKMNALMGILLDMVRPLDDTSSNTQPYGVSSPFSLPPYDSLAPIPLPENTPPFCVNPPVTPQPPSPPSSTIPMPPTGGGGGGGEYPPPASYSPSFPYPNPPPSPAGTVVPSPPESIYPTPFTPPASTGVPSPPETSVPSPFVYVPSPPTTTPVLSPPYYSIPSPPTSYIPSPPSGSSTPMAPSSGGPGGYVPSPQVYLPPNVYPSPLVPPPPFATPTSALWCVAKPSVPGPIIQEAMNYACASGAECDQIQPSGACFEPNTLVAHASYAFNSYWQRTKAAGGTCAFGGIAMLVTVDPSYDGCHFVYM